MPPGQLTPNKFELAILERIAQQVPALKASLAGLRVLRREFTGVGSFTHFQHPDLAPGVSDGPISMNAQVDVPGVPNGMGAVLFVKNGCADILETFTYGSEHWDGVADSFTLRGA
jgi:hypothetical protein